MNIKTFTLGELQVNCYLIEEDDGILVVDPGSRDMDTLINYIESKDTKVKAILLSHGHLDHIEGIEKIIEKFGDLDLYIGSEDYEFLYNPALNLSSFVGRKAFKLSESINVIKIKEGDNIFGFDVLATPGHTIGSKCFYKKDEKMLISGDTMFNNGIGRVDLPTGDHSQIFTSLKKLLNLPEDTIVYPGHGAKTSIKYEKKNKFY